MEAGDSKFSVHVFLVCLVSLHFCITFVSVTSLAVTKGPDSSCPIKKGHLNNDSVPGVCFSSLKIQ